MSNGIYGYYPEMGDAKPVADLEIQSDYRGGWYVYTFLELETNRSVKFDSKITEKQNSKRAGMNLYRVTRKGMDALKLKYRASWSVLLD